jgi:hypothetical protein
MIEQVVHGLLLVELSQLQRYLSLLNRMLQSKVFHFVVEVLHLLLCHVLISFGKGFLWIVSS